MRVLDAQGMRETPRVHMNYVDDRQGYRAVNDGSDITLVQLKAAATACASGTTS